MTFSEKLLKLRKERGLSQEELAERLAVTRQAVSRWENGETLPDAPNLLNLADLFGVSVDALLREGAEWTAPQERAEEPPKAEESSCRGEPVEGKSKRKIPHLLCGFLWIIAAGCMMTAGIISGRIYYPALALIDAVIACVHFYFWFIQSEAWQNSAWHRMKKESRQYLTSALLFLFASLCFFFAGAVGGKLLPAFAGIMELLASLGFFYRWHKSMAKDDL